MKKFVIQIIILLAVILGSLYLAYNQDMITSFLPSKTPTTQQKLKIDDTTVNIEVADTPTKRSKGLSGREILASDSGMLFTFPEAKKYQFWMKDMKIPLDFIFIREGKVVDILTKVLPPVPNQAKETLPIYEPISPIDMLLEVNGGFVLSTNIKIGDEVFLIK